MTICQILKMDSVFAMGLIALSCAPGGGASNSWTLLLGGDTDLSLTMTFFSLVLALGNIILWAIGTRIFVYFKLSCLFDKFNCSPENCTCSPEKNVILSIN